MSAVSSNRGRGTGAYSPFGGASGVGAIGNADARAPSVFPVSRTIIIGQAEAAVADIALTVDDATIGNNVDNVALVQANTLVVQDATVGNNVDNVALVQQNTLAVDDATVGNNVDNVALTQQNTLAVQDATVGNNVDNVVLSPDVTDTVLSVQDATVGNNVESPDLTQQNVLTVQDATIALTVDNVVLVDVVEPTPRPSDFPFPQGFGALGAERRRKLGKALHEALTKEEKPRRKKKPVPKLETPLEVEQQQDIPLSPDRRAIGSFAPFAPSPALGTIGGIGTIEGSRQLVTMGAINPWGEGVTTVSGSRTVCRHGQLRPRGIQNLTTDQAFELLLAA